jgi:hypothetical protein
MRRKRNVGGGVPLCIFKQIKMSRSSFIRMSK